MNTHTPTSATPACFNTAAAPLLTTAQAAAWLKIAPDTLLEWLRTGQGPQWVRINQKTIRFRLSDLVTFAEENRAVRQ